MQKPAIISAALLAGTIGLTAVPGWSGGGYHGSPSAAEHGRSWGDHVQGRDSSERSVTEGSRSADAYSQEGTSEFQRQQQNTGTSMRDGVNDEYSEERSAARDRGSHAWNMGESKDDRDFHS